MDRYITYVYNIYIIHIHIYIYVYVYIYIYIYIYMLDPLDCFSFTPGFTFYIQTLVYDKYRYLSFF